MSSIPSWMLQRGAQIDGDRWLLRFATFEDYLDALVTEVDLANLRSNYVAQRIAELGFRSHGETLSRDQFRIRRARVVEALNPTAKPYKLVAPKAELSCRFLRELAYRERANRVGLLHTILFIRNFTPQGHEVSGYIDYAHRLCNEDWTAIFGGDKLIWPRTTDLGFYHWRLGLNFSNDSDNYRVLIDPRFGLLFLNKLDRKVVCVDPSSSPGENTTRVPLSSTDYTQVVLYDHIVRRKG